MRFSEKFGPAVDAVEQEHQADAEDVADGGFAGADGQRVEPEHRELRGRAEGGGHSVAVVEHEWDNQRVEDDGRQRHEQLRSERDARGPADAERPADEIARDRGEQRRQRAEDDVDPRAAEYVRDGAADRQSRDGGGRERGQHAERFGKAELDACGRDLPQHHRQRGVKRGGQRRGHKVPYTFVFHFFNSVVLFFRPCGVGEDGSELTEGDYNTGARELQAKVSPPEIQKISLDKGGAVCYHSSVALRRDVRAV